MSGSSFDYWGISFAVNDSQNDNVVGLDPVQDFVGKSFNDVLPCPFVFAVDWGQILYRVFKGPRSDGSPFRGRRKNNRVRSRSFEAGKELGTLFAAGSLSKDIDDVFVLTYWVS